MQIHTQENAVNLEGSRAATKQNCLQKFMEVAKNPELYKQMHCQLQAPTVASSVSASLGKTSAVFQGVNAGRADKGTTPVGRSLS